MSNVLIEADSMTAIANAIRTKKGVSTTYKPAQMPDAISSISTGGITPTGTINITTNGTHDVTNYASASVAVPTGSTPTGTKQISITQNGTTTEDVTNYASAEITVNVQGGEGISAKDILQGDQPSGAVSFKATKTLPTCAISGRTSLTSLTIDLTDGYVLNGYVIQNNPNLEKLTLINPKETAVNTNYGSYCITGNSRLSIIVIKGKIYGGSQSCFRSNSGLQIFDLEDSGLITNNSFLGSNNLKTLILRQNSVLSISGTTFTGSALAGANGAVVYVPQSMIETYKTASFWSTMFNNGYITFEAIEGSTYETQYADGTPISA